MSCTKFIAHQTTEIFRLTLDASKPIWKDPAIILFNILSRDVQCLCRFHYIHIVGPSHWNQIDHRSSF